MIKQAKPIALIILDGWGHREESQYNPIQEAETPFFDFLFQTYPNTLIEASGAAVGLPTGQMGNSEVGHLHIGAGRKIPQYLTRINEALQDGEFLNNPALLKAIETAKKNASSIHILGLISPGGVHSHEKHIQALVDMVGEHGVEKSYFHALLDGRDVPPKSAMASLTMLDAHYKKYPGGKIASLIGRYYAMDRDRRWERTRRAYDLLTQGKADYRAATASAALQMAYDRGETDEFVKPTVITAEGEEPITLKDGDVVIFMNFRADRARQITHALTDNNFSDFPRDVTPKLASFVSLTNYSKDIHTDVAFHPIPVKNSLGEYIADKGLKQLRIAETEKYAHVTYFINAGREQPFQNEDRILVPSPKVATYDLQPEMSAIEVTDKFVEAIESNQYDLIICNYANPDMIGHTGIHDAAKKAVLIMDQCVKRIVTSLKKVGGEALITADHGNIEIMYDDDNAQAHTAHTNNLVPLLYVGHQAKFQGNAGALDDIAPTLLYLLNLKKPKEMTGRVLLEKS